MVAAAAAQAAANAVAIPPCVRTSAHAFKAWLTIAIGLVQAHRPYIVWDFSAVTPLGAHTKTRTLQLWRGGAVAGTDFVIHTHPGAAGASVGHGYASKVHFKPGDGAIHNASRLYEHDLTADQLALLNQAKVGM